MRWTNKIQKICEHQGFFLVVFQEEGEIGILRTVDRERPESPAMIGKFRIGQVPSFILPNSDCSLLVVSNVNVGEGLAQGGVTIVRGLHDYVKHKIEPDITTIFADNGEWDDDYMLRRGLHMPLTKNALLYWDNYSPIADELNYSSVIDNYHSAIFLEPESMAWTGPDEKEVLLNLQTNNGLLRVDIEANRIVAAVGYGLKDHGVVPVDIDSSDGTCNLKTYPDLFAMRSPDTISTLLYNNRRYVATPNEGEKKKYDGFTESKKLSDIFTVSTTIFRYVQS